MLDIHKGGLTAILRRCTIVHNVATLADITPIGKLQLGKCAMWQLRKPRRPQRTASTGANCAECWHVISTGPVTAPDWASINSGMQLDTDVLINSLGKLRTVRREEK